MKKLDGSDYDLLIISSERICDYYFKINSVSKKKKNNRKEKQSVLKENNKKMKKRTKDI